MSDLQSKHEYKIKLQEVEVEGKVLDEFEGARKWMGIVESVDKAVQD